MILGTVTNSSASAALAAKLAALDKNTQRTKMTTPALSTTLLHIPHNPTAKSTTTIKLSENSSATSKARLLLNNNDNNNTNNLDQTDTEEEEGDELSLSGDTNYDPIDSTTKSTSNNSPREVDALPPDLSLDHGDDTEVEVEEEDDEEETDFIKVSQHVPTSTEIRQINITTNSSSSIGQAEKTKAKSDLVLPQPEHSIGFNYRITIECKSLWNPEAICPVWDPETIKEHTMLYEEFKDMPGVFDEDDEDSYDIAMAPEYSDTIFEYMRELEFKYRPDPGYMKYQFELDWNVRGVLMDWLVRIHDHCNFLPETLFLTANYIDRFLSVKAVGQPKLQLVGIVALFVAAKYEEISCPTVPEIAYLVDGEYSTDDIIRAERYMIHLLEFNLGWPGPMSFLRRSSKADDYDSDTRTLAKYLLETTIMDLRFVGSPPSWLAAAAHNLSRKILDRGPWSKAHAYFSGYTEAQLQPAVEIMMDCCRDPLFHHRSIYNKYSHARFQWASLHVAHWISQN